MLGVSPGVAGLALALLVGGGLVLWALRDAEFRSSSNNLLAGLGIGAVIAAMWWIIGHMGFAAFATMRGMTALLRNKTVDQFSFDIKGGNAVPAWLSAMLGVSPGVAGLALALLVGGGLVLWALRDAEFRSSSNNLLAGIGIGAVIAAMWWIIGHMGFVPEHPETLEPVYLGTAGGSMQALSFTSPMARTLEWVIFFDASTTLTLGVVSVIGVVLGAMAYALYNRSFHWEGFRGTQDTALHIAGGLLMGIGGVTAGGCTVGQGLSGLSTLSVTSMIAVTGIMLGAIGGLRFQMWLLMRE
ncbi:MAG TPA: YeeE/YedE thiosulfate transporter family protein, partial [Rhodoferax sp.]|nr:YeeE/YedE thiosulfate transporter family protein [Rhodoferax sp.]